MATHWSKANQRYEAFKSLGKVGLYILLPLAIICVPTSWLEARPSICLIRYVFGRPCPGCGMTRAISCVFHAKFTRALQHNRLVVFVLPLLCYTWFQALRVEYKRFISIHSNEA
ncbi:MAG: DUF2752 domain-containing protein [Ktedonobacteraceae bacterium]